MRERNLLLLLSISFFVKQFFLFCVWNLIFLSIKALLLPEFKNIVQWNWRSRINGVFSMKYMTHCSSLTFLCNSSRAPIPLLSLSVSLHFSEPIWEIQDFSLSGSSDFLIKISSLTDTSPPSPPCLNDSVMVDPGYPFDDGDANEGSDKNFASFFLFFFPFTSFLVSE